MLTERPIIGLNHPSPPLPSPSSPPLPRSFSPSQLPPSGNGHNNGSMAEDNNNNNSINQNGSSQSPSSTAAGINVPMEVKRMFRFLHSALAIVSLIWLTVCLLIYFHAPSYQSQHLFDCRWHLASLVVQALFGHLLVFCSRSSLLFCASFLSSQYAAVYSLLTLIIYSLDTSLLMLFPRSPTGIAMDFGPYLKLTAVFIVLSAFGLGLSIAHMANLLRIGQILAKQEKTIGTTTVVPQTASSFGTSPTLTNIRTLRALTGCQAALALLSIYVAASLAPMKFWYVRTHLVQEFSCSLLAVSLALLQFLVFRLPNGGGSLLVKGIVLANAAQLVQELNLDLSAFYTFFYVDRIYDAVEERTSMFTGSAAHSHVQLALARVEHAQSVLALNLVFHICRMMLNAFMLWNLAPKVFGAALSYRVKFKLDSEMVQADEQWARVRGRERRWLYSVALCVLAIAVGHVLLNFGYIWASMIFESLSVATGLSFVFSVCLLASIGLFAFRLLRFCLILSAYVSINLLVTASLLLFAFVQDFFFLATTLDNDDKDVIMTSLNSSASSAFDNGTNETSVADSAEDSGHSALKIFLFFADFVLSLGTFSIAALTLRYAVGTLVRTKTLQSQPSNVQRAVRLLRALSLVGIVSAIIEFLLLAELRIGKSSTMSHLSINSSFYDWLLTTAQFVFLFYVTRFERFQALLPVQILQLASVTITTLDLIGQQTETVQIYVNSVLQFYRITEALFRRPLLTDHGGAGPPSAIFVAHTTALAMPLYLFVDILALHFMQVFQWVLTVGTLAISLYCVDNMAENESEQSNDFHELRRNSINNQQAQAHRDEESPPPPCPTSSTPPPSSKVRNGFKHQHFNNSAFDNQMYNMEEAEEERQPKTGKKVEEEEEDGDGGKKKGKKGEEEMYRNKNTPSNESSPYKDINLH